MAGSHFEEVAGQREVRKVRQAGVLYGGREPGRCEKSLKFLGVRR